jgi:CheY-like chemotaxis protein
MDTSGPRPVALIVEPDEERRAIAATLLEESGLDTYAVSDLDAAEAFIERSPWRLGFLFLDTPSRRAEDLIDLVHEHFVNVYVAATCPTIVNRTNVRRLGHNWAPLDLLIAAVTAAELYQRTHRRARAAPYRFN